MAMGIIVNVLLIPNGLLIYTSINKTSFKPIRVSNSQFTFSGLSGSAKINIETIKVNWK